MKKIVLALVTLLISFSINAQIDFQPHITVDDTGGTNNPKSVFAADLDGDGDMDILSASQNDNKIAWYENTDGQGNFGPQQIISETLLNPYSVFAADLDGDGDIDVLAASLLGDTIGWFENTDSEGNFGAYQIISTLTDGASSIYAVDADGDGDIDVFSTSGGDGKIAWYENMDGQANFGSQQVISSNFENVVYLTSGDIDGDGDLDILSGKSGYEGSIVWFKNADAQGNFVEQQIISTDVRFCKSAVLADMDGDGDLDIAAISIRDSGTPAAIWFENTNGQGNFSNTSKLIAVLNTTGTLFPSDFDNDGDIDIAVGAENSGLSWFKNNGNGSFGSQINIDSEVADIDSIFATDIDNDGDQDLLIAAGTADRIAWHENINGLGNFSPANELADINGANGTYNLHSADLDGDGDKDIIAALAFDNRIAWQENLDGNGNYSELKTVSTLKSANTVVAGDMDGDGDIDIIASGNSKIAWYENVDGQGNFSQEHLIFYNQYSLKETVYATDIDNDGDLDIFSCEDNRIFWQENLDGLGSFGSPQTISDQYYSSDSMVAADIDNDGDKDLVASYYVDGKVVWFENLDGQGNFSSLKLIDSLSSPESVDVGDFDNDGDIDILTLDFGTDQVMWYENLDGQGTFGEARIISDSVESAFSIKATDIDNDGDMDVLATSYSTATLWLFQNNGNGTFDNGQPFTSAVKSPIFITADDFNGDGKMDVLAPSYSKDQIIWFENRGPLGIEENITNLSSIYPNPTNGLLNIKSATPISKVTIYNNLGQLLFSSEKIDQIDISTLNEGIYFIKVSDENGQTQTKKVVKK